MHKIPILHLLQLNTTMQRIIGGPPLPLNNLLYMSFQYKILYKTERGITVTPIFCRHNLYRHMAYGTWHMLFPDRLNPQYAPIGIYMRHVFCQLIDRAHICINQ